MKSADLWCGGTLCDFAPRLSGPHFHRRAGGPKAHVNFSKLNPHEFIGGFERLAIACLHGEADKRSGLGRPKRTPNPHYAGVGTDRAAPSNCRAGGQDNSLPVLPSFGAAAVDLAVALLAGMARKPYEWLFPNLP